MAPWFFLEFPTSDEGPRGHELLHHVTVLDLLLDEVHMVRADLLEESLKVIYRWPCLELATLRDGRDAPHAEAICVLVVIVIIVEHGHDPLRALPTPLLSVLGAPLGVSDGGGGWCHIVVAWVASLLLGTGRCLTASLLVAYWVAMLRNSLVMYLKTLFGSQKGDGCCTPLLDAFGPGPLGLSRCPIRLLCLP
jgi:hypothetical protein